MSWPVAGDPWCSAPRSLRMKLRIFHMLSHPSATETRRKRSTTLGRWGIDGQWHILFAEPGAREPLDWSQAHSRTQPEPVLDAVINPEDRRY